MSIPMAVFDRIDGVMHGESSWRLRFSIAIRTMTILAMSGDLRWTVLSLGLGILSRWSVSAWVRIAVAWRERVGVRLALLPGWQRRC